MKYEDFLNTKFWKDQSLRVKARDGFSCRLCGQCKNIEAHHTSYKNNLFDVPDEDIITLCRSCHKELHDKKVDKQAVIRVTDDFIRTYQNKDFSKGGIYNLTRVETVKHFIEEYREQCTLENVGIRIEIIKVRESFSDFQTAYIQRLKNKGYSLAQVEKKLHDINPDDPVIGKTSLYKKYYFKGE